MVDKLFLRETSAKYMHEIWSSHFHVLLHVFGHFFSISFSARSSAPVAPSLSFPFSVSQVREIVCVSNIRALSTACALISCSQTWENMSARIQYQPFQHRANGLLSERAEKQTRMTQTRTPIHTSPFHLRASPFAWISGGLEPVFSMSACGDVWIRTGKSINHIGYSIGHNLTQLHHILCISIRSVHTSWHVQVLHQQLIKNTRLMENKTWH